MKYFLSNDKCHPLCPDDFSDFLEQFSFRVNSVGSWKRDYRKRADYTISDIEFIFYVKGGSKTTILGTEHSCSVNDFMILEPMHLYTSENLDQVETEYYFIHFDIHPLYSTQQFLQRLPARVIHIQNPELILHLFAIIQDEFKSQWPGYISKINACIKIMAIEVFRNRESGAVPLCAGASAPMTTEAFVNQCIAYIGANLSGDCSIKMLQQQFSVSSSYLYKSFMTVLGESPSNYVTRLRIARAKSLLMNDLFTIEQVAGEVGYTSLSHFSKAFKRHTQCSPSCYRNSRKA